MRPAFSLLAIALLAASPASGQDASNFPNQTIKIIVTVPAGGGVDTMTRIVAEKLRQKFGQPVIVENRGGQSGNVGAEAVFSAEPDGYTLMASQPAPLTVNALLYRKLNFDPAALIPVAVMTRIPNTLTVRSNFPARTYAEFLAYARANPGKINYASQGTGTTSHLTAELFQTRTGTKLVHVPYKGTAPALNDLIAGHVDVFFNELATTIAHHRAEKVRILAVTTPERSPQVPEIPTLIELGLAGFVSDTWNAISAPPKTPPAIVAKLNGAVVEGMNTPDTVAQLGKMNVQPMGLNPQQAAEFIAVDAKRWADVIRNANITPQ